MRTVCAGLGVDAVVHLVILSVVPLQIMSSLRRLGQFDDAQSLVRPIVGCQETFRYRNKLEVRGACLQG